ncbi:hypothetical protein K488DRAFT_84679 [Vararia minispora EC-137]|uniref:Uncharacterized protein n=1 Tax=Vararia minispora EC-137 TaxID=1314806 RepID=A0ACB8QPV0_9AGAM|nr:hypothetical protein K488DRAFT_84679 [Vararia minispora EC-137]
MALPPSRKSILSLYAATLRTSQSFSSYNFREYFLRRTKSTFQEFQKESSPERLNELYSSAKKELAVLKRSAIVNRLYGGWRLAVEDQKPARERGNN